MSIFFTSRSSEAVILPYFRAYERVSQMQQVEALVVKLKCRENVDLHSIARTATLDMNFYT
jgi:hypothetical protein